MATRAPSTRKGQKVARGVRANSAMLREGVQGRNKQNGRMMGLCYGAHLSAGFLGRPIVHAGVQGPGPVCLLRVTTRVLLPPRAVREPFHLLWGLAVQLKLCPTRFRDAILGLGLGLLVLMNQGIPKPGVRSVTGAKDENQGG